MLNSDHNPGIDNMPQSINGVALWRRLLAIFYDTLVVMCMVFILWQPVPLLDGLNLPQWLAHSLRLGYLIAIIFIFFAWFWTHGGQTMGMRAWQIKLISNGASETMGWKQCFVRFVVASLSWSALGLGFLWSLLDPEKRTWHDTASASQLILAPRKGKGDSTP